LQAELNEFVLEHAMDADFDRTADFISLVEMGKVRTLGIAIKHSEWKIS